MRTARSTVLSLALASFCAVPAFAASTENPSEAALRVVLKIQRADYEGDRAALKRLHDELPSVTGDPHLAARVDYWRGFALWRRAINGFNDHVDAKEQEADLTQAVDDFTKAEAEDPSFIDPKIGEYSCVGLIAFATSKKDPDRIREVITQLQQIKKSADAIAPDNPRLLWVWGPTVWNIPAERGGGQAKAIEVYQHALDALRKNPPAAGDPLEPSWGEPELLMSVAWSDLNKKTPDLDAAEQYANAALKLVPYWHYVRDILIPNIAKARLKS